MLLTIRTYVCHNTMLLIKYIQYDAVHYITYYKSKQNLHICKTTRRFAVSNLLYHDNLSFVFTKVRKLVGNTILSEVSRVSPPGLTFAHISQVKNLLYTYIHTHVWFVVIYQFPGIISLEFGSFISRRKNVLHWRLLYDLLFRVKIFVK